MRPVHRALCWLLLVAAMTATQPAKAIANGLHPNVLSELFASADVVMQVEIADASTRSVDGEECGIRYTGNVLESYKASQDLSGASVIHFGRGTGLEFGVKYLVFLSFQSSEEAVYAELQNDPYFAAFTEPKERVLELIRCEGLVPGLTEKFSWVVANGDVVVPPEVLLQFPDSLHVDDQSGPMYFIRMSSMSAYLHELANDEE